MENIISKKCQCGKSIPSFGLPTDKSPTCCIKCKSKNMVNIAYKKCKSNETHNIPCDIKANNKYNDYCTHCFANLFPNNPKTLQIKAKSKELKVVNHISSIFKGFTHDKPLYIDLSGGCCPSKRRIDLRKLIGNTLLCIEIDEDQHKSYNKVDEVRRYNNLFMDFSGKYVFIRYNPDPYKVNGIRRNPKFNTRITELVNKIKELEKHIQNGKNKELIEIHHMYYDE
jgi:hypothetical protein